MVPGFFAWMNAVNTQHVMWSDHWLNKQWKYFSTVLCCNLYSYIMVYLPFKFKLGSPIIHIICQWQSLGPTSSPPSLCVLGCPGVAAAKVTGYWEQEHPQGFTDFTLPTLSFISAVILIQKFIRNLTPSCIK